MWWYQVILLNNQPFISAHVCSLSSMHCGQSKQTKSSWDIVPLGPVRIRQFFHQRRNGPRNFNCWYIFINLFCSWRIGELNPPKWIVTLFFSVTTCVRATGFPCAVLNTRCYQIQKVCSRWHQMIWIGSANISYIRWWQCIGVFSLVSSWMICSSTLFNSSWQNKSHISSQL